MVRAFIDNGGPIRSRIVLKASAYVWTIFAAIVLTIAVIVAPIMLEPLRNGDAHSGLESAYFLSQVVIMVVVLVGLVFAINEVKRSRLATEAQLFEATAQRIVSHSKEMMEQSDLLLNLKNRAATSDPAFQARTDFLAQINLDFFDTERLKARAYPRLVDRFPTSERWVFETMVEYPRIIEVLKLRREWYSYGLYSLAMRAETPLTDGDAASPMSWGKLAWSCSGSEVNGLIGSRRLQADWGILPGDWVFMRDEKSRCVKVLRVMSEADERLTTTWDRATYSVRTVPSAHVEAKGTCDQLIPGKVVALDRWLDLFDIPG